MLKLRSLIALATAVLAVSLVPSAAQAAVSARVSGQDGGGAFSWAIEYDDTTRAVTTTASGTGFCLVTIQLTPTLSRTVAYFPVSGGQSINGDLAQRMAAADFQVISDGSITTLASNIPPAQIQRITGKAQSTMGGFQSQSEWSRL
jgi:hypothetical protein